MSFAGVRALGPVKPEVGRWYHLVGVRDTVKGELRLYVDGELAGTRRRLPAAGRADRQHGDRPRQVRRQPGRLPRRHGRPGPPVRPGAVRDEIKQLYDSDDEAGPVDDSRGPCRHANLAWRHGPTAYRHVQPGELRRGQPARPALASGSRSCARRSCGCAPTSPASRRCTGRSGRASRGPCIALRELLAEHEPRGRRAGQHQAEGRRRLRRAQPGRRHAAAGAGPAAAAQRTGGRAHVPPADRGAARTRSRSRSASSGRSCTSQLDRAAGRPLHVINVHLKSKIPTADPRPEDRQLHLAYRRRLGRGLFISSMKRMAQALEVRRLVDQILDADPDARDRGGRRLQRRPGRGPGAGDPRQRRGHRQRRRWPAGCWCRSRTRCRRPARYTLFHQGRGEMLDHMLVTRNLLAHYRGSEIHNELLHDESAVVRHRPQVPRIGRPCPGLWPLHP